MDRAIWDLTVRSVNEDQRIIRGVATTGRLDRASDRIDPMGVTFKNPAILLLQHDHARPVGTVTFDQPTKAGVGFTAHIPKIAEPGILQDRTEEAFQSVKSGIIRHVSIGFRPTQAPSFNEEGGFDYPAVELYELSLCSVPCQPDAEILEVRRAGSRVVRVETAKKRSVPVVRLSGVTRAAWNGTLKINTASRNKPGQPFKIRKINRTGTRVVKLSPEARVGPDKPKKPLPVVKLTEADKERGSRRLNHRVVRIGRR